MGYRFPHFDCTVSKKCLVFTAYIRRGGKWVRIGWFKTKCGELEIDNGNDSVDSKTVDTSIRA